MEKDLAQIRTRACRLEEENWKFREYLKFSVPAAKLDRLVRDLSSNISAQIDCRKCANCCRTMTVCITNKDVVRIANTLQMSKKDVIDQYLVASIEPAEEKYFIADKPCPFLNGNDCSIYESRPEVCRSFPHLHKKNFAQRLISVIANYSECPIVFNVYEILKQRLRWKCK